MTLLKSSISLLAATGAVAFPRYPLYKRADVDSFISSQTPISLQGVLNNIGDNGTLVSGASSGVVVASPSKDDPDYFYTWTRDAGMTLAALIEELRAGNADLESTIQNYVDSQATLQSVDNPSGGLSDGSGLGEPKFNVDLSQFTDEWGRPQSDGPALRASALIAYGNHLAKNGSTSVVSSNIWPIVQNDLAYVGEYWNETGFDLWEEVEGTSFFTTAVQFKALVEGAAFAEALGETCDSCSVAPQILCHLQEFWDGSAIVSNSPTNGRAGVDANSVIASLNLFDPEAGCDDATFQPCSAKALANHKVYVDSFRDIYGINSGIGAGKAVATGRYSEDTYQGGNPWYLTTLAAAEQLYDALYQWDKQGSIDITNVSLPFFTDLVNNTQAGSFASSSSEYESITSAVKAYADGFVGIVQAYTPSDGALAEQFSRDSGDPASAALLTWSFASFLTTVARRNGQVPLSWGSSTASEVPSQCSGETVAGTYASPSVGSW